MVWIRMSWKAIGGSGEVGCGKGKTNESQERSME